MGMEERIRHLLAAAGRAEAEGDLRTARILRRMASEPRPAGTGDGRLEPSEHLRAG